MSETRLDFSALEKLNLPPIEDIPGNTEDVLGEDSIEEAAQAALKEVESLEDFKDPIDEEDEVEIPEAITPEKEIEEPEVSVIQGLSEWAKAKGLFDYKEEEFEDSEDFLESKLIEKSKVYSQEWKDSLPKVVKEIIENYEEGIPLDELVYSKSREIEYNNIADRDLETQEELQKKLVADWLYTQDYTEDEVKSKLKKLEDAFMLEDEARTALKKLKVYESKYQEQLKNQVQEQKQADEKAFATRIKNIQTEILSAEEVIKGIKLSKEDKQKLFDSYTKLDSKGETALTKAIKSDPQAWYKITQFMVLMGGDLSKVEQKLNTENTKKIKAAVNTYQETPGLSKLTSPEALKAMRKAINQAKKNK